MSSALTKGWQTRPVHVTVLILSVDEAHLLERSLPAALAQEPRPDVVVIDNASADATAELVRRHAARHPPPTGRPGRCVTEPAAAAASFRSGVGARRRWGSAPRRDPGCAAAPTGW